MAKIIQLTQANGDPALANAEAITHVITPPAQGAAPGARAIVYVGGRELAVRETVVDIKALL